MQYHSLVQCVSFLIGFTLLLSPLKAAPNQKPSQPPNILFILADDLGIGDVTCYNLESKAPTPYMDQLATQGMRFTDAHSPSSVCSPTRYAILTGRYAWRSRLKLGVLNPWDKALIEPGRLTMPQMLKAAGYSTSAFGKWHLGWNFATKDGLPLESGDTSTYKTRIDYNRPITDGPTTRGFDYFFGMVGMTPGEPALIENDRPIFDGREIGPAIDGVSPSWMSPWKDENTPFMLNEKVIWYLKQRAAEPTRQPFFLYYALTTPHQPIMPAGQFRGKTGSGEACDFVHQTDYCVGKVLETLDQLGLAENTIVIMTSDNGSPGYAEADSPTASVQQRYNHQASGPWRGMKADAHEGGHRIPLIIRWPGHIKPGSTNAETVCLVDFMATFAAMLAQKIPNNAAEDSYNILPALLDQSAASPIREATVHHALIGMFAIRKGPWKLIEGIGSGGFTMPQFIAVKEGPVGRNGFKGQLYNLDNDPAETRNLYNSHPETVQELMELLNRYRDSGRSTPLKTDMPTSK